jgi:hypothetical protein
LVPANYDYWFAKAQQINSLIGCPKWSSDILIPNLRSKIGFIYFWGRANLTLQERMNDIIGMLSICSLQCYWLLKGKFWCQVDTLIENDEITARLVFWRQWTALPSTTSHLRFRPQG